MLFFWKSEKYVELDHTLAFVELMNLDAERTLEILRMMDTFYGETDQDTEEWALEYQLLTRMLIKNQSLLVNPYYLQLCEVEGDFENVLSAVDYNAFVNGVHMSQAEIESLHDECGEGWVPMQPRDAEEYEDEDV